MLLRLQCQQLPDIDGGWFANSDFPPNMSKQSTVCCAHLAVYTCTACVVWCGIGHEELMFQSMHCVSKRQSCRDNFTCCHTETQIAKPRCYLTHSQNTDALSASPSTDPEIPHIWQGSHWRISLFVRISPAGSNPWISHTQADTLLTTLSLRVPHPPPPPPPSTPVPVTMNED